VLSSFAASDNECVVTLSFSHESSLGRSIRWVQLNEDWGRVIR